MLRSRYQPPLLSVRSDDEPELRVPPERPRHSDSVRVGPQPRLGPLRTGRPQRGDQRVFAHHHHRGVRPGARKDAVAMLTEDDVDLICEMFWLPHSHGALVNKLLRDLQYYKENVPVMYTEGKRTKGSDRKLFI